MSKIIGVMFSTLMLATVFFQGSSLSGQSPVELGQVDWGRDLAAAQSISSQTGKPLFVQFQEVPG